MSLTQEYQDCNFVITRKASAQVEGQNIFNTIVLILDEMAVIDADQPRRSKFDTMYKKIDDGYDKNTHDAYIVALQALKDYLVDEGWIEED